ncbi:MAG: hypothetical protein NTX38_00980 [Methylobacter sp.]|nr:hypothetical protein [Methylobacter sp.]
MGNTTLSHGGGAKDRFEKAEMKAIRSEMMTKQIDLDKRQAELIAQLAKGFDNDTFRKLNVVNHNIEVAASRLKGEWIHGNFLQIASTKGI